MAEELAQSSQYSEDSSPYPSLTDEEVRLSLKLGQEFKQTNHTSAADLTAMLHYWHARMALIRICFRLHARIPGRYGIHNLPLMSGANDEIRRMFNDAIAAIRFARVPMCSLQRRVFVQVLLMCWGTFREGHIDLALDESCDQLQEWLLAKVNGILQPRIPINPSEHDLDLAAYCFVGGPIIGRFKQLFE